MGNDDDDDARDEDAYEDSHRWGDGAFDYLHDFDLERDEAVQRLNALEAAVIDELALRDEDDDPDQLERDVFGDELRDPDAVSETLDAEDSAAFDDPIVRDAIETGSAFTSTAFADASELGDLELRHQRPSRWGRLDLTVAWRRAWTPAPLVVSLGPLTKPPIGEHYETADTVLFLATWSR